MNLKESMGRRLHRHDAEGEVNLTAVMNIFLILIPFLLLTATFVRITILELSLPSVSPNQTRATQPPAEPAVLHMLEIRRDGLQLDSEEMNFAEIPTTGDSYNWDTLAEQLDRLKEQYPESSDMIISPRDDITYQTIITVMDRCRDAGFPNVSISG